eukprot:scaffold2267_cov102-Skeletonema_dohrnii-CCMP3373.AAC.2
MLSRPIFDVECNGSVGGFSYRMRSDVFDSTSARHHLRPSGGPHAMCNSCWHSPQQIINLTDHDLKKRNSLVSDSFFLDDSNSSCRWRIQIYHVVGEFKFIRRPCSVLTLSSALGAPDRLRET